MIYTAPCKAAVKRSSKNLYREHRSRDGVAVAEDIATELEVRRELQVIDDRSLHPERIVQLYEALEDANDVYMVLEYCPHGELYELVAAPGPLPTDVARYIFAQLVEGAWQLVRHVPSLQ